MGKPIPMFTRDGTPHRDGQVHDRLCDRPHPLDARVGLEIDERPHVQAAGRGVGVPFAVRPMLRQDPVHLADIGSQLPHRHRHILHERDRLGVPGDRHEQPQPRFADRPQIGLLLGSADHPAPGGQRLRSGLRLPGTVAGVFDDQQRRWITLNETELA